MRESLSPPPCTICRADTASRDDRRDFDGLVRRHHRQAYRVAYRMTGSTTDAEDLTQETFLRAFRFFASYRSDLPFERWLYRIMSNLFIDGCRRRPKFEIKSLDQPLGRCRDSETVFPEIPDPGADPEQVMLSTVLGERAQSALMRLPQYYRLTVILADIEDLSYQEISAVMGCPLGAVRSRLHRGRKMLRAFLLEAPAIGTTATIGNG